MSSIKTISITYSECVFVALVVQDGRRMLRVVLSSVACPVLQYFPNLYHKRHDFRKTKLRYWTQNVCFDFP